MEIERGPSMKFCYFWDRKMCRGSPFESDMRTDGELPASVQFLVVYKPTATTLCFECLEIKTSAIITLWSRIVDVEFDEFDYHVFSIDQDNYVVRIVEEDIDRDQFHHVILSTAVITKYQNSQPSYMKLDDVYGMFEEKLLRIEKISTVDILFFPSTEDEHKLKPVCAFKNYYDEAYSFCNGELLCKRTIGVSQLTRVSIPKLLDFIDDDDQDHKEINVQIAEDDNIDFVNLPVIDLFSVGEKQMMGKYASREVIGRSKIGCVWKNKIEIYT